MKTPQQIILELLGHGCTQSEIATEVGLTQGRISRIYVEGGGCSFEAGRKLEALLLEKTSDKPDLQEKKAA